MATQSKKIGKILLTVDGLNPAWVFPKDGKFKELKKLPDSKMFRDIFNTENHLRYKSPGSLTIKYYKNLVQLAQSKNIIFISAKEGPDIWQGSKQPLKNCHILNTANAEYQVVDIIKWCKMKDRAFYADLSWDNLKWPFGTKKSLSSALENHELWIAYLALAKKVEMQIGSQADATLSTPSSFAALADFVLSAAAQRPDGSLLLNAIQLSAHNSFASNRLKNFLEVAKLQDCLNISDLYFASLPSNHGPKLFSSDYGYLFAAKTNSIRLKKNKVKSFQQLHSALLVGRKI